MFWKSCRNDFFGAGGISSRVRLYEDRWGQSRAWCPTLSHKKQVPMNLPVCG
jgi:hypothetical protein